MIYESEPWRRDLIGDVALIERWSAAKISERQMFLLEKKLFLTAFVVRKLYEARKIPDRVIAREIGVKSFATKSIPTWFGCGDIEKHFTLDVSLPTKIPNRDLFNIIIHSYVLVFDVGKGSRITGFYVASDRTKKKRLLRVSLHKYMRLCRDIAAARQKRFHWELLPDGREAITVT